MIGFADIDLRLLRVFVVVARSGGFTAAEAALNLSQSTISNHMTALEQRLGYKLCRRGRSGFQITDKGWVVLHSAERLFGAIDSYRQSVHTIKASLSGEFRLGIIDNITADPRCPLIEAFRLFNLRDHAVTFNIKMLAPKDLQMSVLDGTLHMGIGYFPKKITGLNYRKLYTENHNLYCGYGNPLFKLNEKEVSFEKIRENKIIAKDYLDLKDIAMLGFSTADARVNEIETELMLILSGSYIGYLPEHVALRWLAKGMLRRLMADQLNFHIPIHLIMPKGVSVAPATDAFQTDLLSANSQINPGDKDN